MKFLVIQQKMIGDVLTSTILCESLKKRFAGCEVHYLVNSHTTAVVKGNPFIDELILFTPEIQKSISARRALRKRLKNEHYDGVIDAYSKIGSALMAWATKADTIIGYKKWYTQPAYTHTISYKTSAETEAGLAIENRMKLLTPISADFPVELKPRLYVSEEETAFAKAELKKHHIHTDRPLFMISVLGSSPDKTYPLAYLAEVLDHIVAKTNAQLLLNYIPNQKDDVEKLIAHCNSATRTAIKEELYGKSLREFIALTKECDALIGNEGGAVNMAKALNVPTFAIFSPWIKKEDWSLYADENNVAVHLADVNTDHFKHLKVRQIKKKAGHFYEQFAPHLFKSVLDDFLNHLVKNKGNTP